MLEVEQFFTEWANTAWAFFSAASLIFIIYRISSAEADKRAAKEARIVALESKVNEGENRIDKLSSLCESLIESNKKAFAMGYGASMLAKSKDSGI